MSRAAIRSALETQLASINPAWPTAWENSPFKPEIGQCWQRVKLMLADTVALGAGPTSGEQWQGVMHVTAWIPSGIGSAMAEERGEVIRQAFPHGSVLEAGGVQLTCLTPYYGPALDETEWYGLPVLVPWFANVL